MTVVITNNQRHKKVCHKKRQFLLLQKKHKEFIKNNTLAIKRQQRFKGKGIIFLLKKLKRLF